MRTIYVSPDFPLNRRMRKAVQRGKLRVVREGGERSELSGGMSDNMSPTDFVECLAAVGMDTETVFNPYSDCCREHDLPNAPELRRNNLAAILKAAMSADAVDLWVGQEPGYRGARRTGLALTDDYTLDKMSEMFDGAHLEKATRTCYIREQTAQAVWKILPELDCKVFAWNVFPFHSHRRGNPEINREHNSDEQSVGEQFLRLVLDALKPRRVVAIGRDAECVLNKMETRIPVKYACHPSRTIWRRRFYPQVGGIYGMEFSEDGNKIIQL